MTSPIRILTDSTASIPPALVQELGIEIVPYIVVRGLVNLRDGVDVQPGPFAAYLETCTTLPTTSAPSPGDYLNSLKRLAETSQEIVALTMTAKGSAAYQSCITATEYLAEWMPQVRVHVIDTLQVAMSQGWAVIEAARAALAGCSIDDVLARARDVAQRGMMIQTADTLRYLYMGGRIGRAQHLVGSLLNIKPLIGMEDGVITALGAVRSRLGAYGRMVDLMRPRAGPGARLKVAFTYCGAQELSETLREQVLHTFNCIEVIITPLSPALAVHSGPGTVGVSFFPEDR